LCHVGDGLAIFASEPSAIIRTASSFQQLQERPMFSASGQSGDGDAVGTIDVPPSSMAQFDALAIEPWTGVRKLVCRVW
jgi:hypothetical protein